MSNVYVYILIMAGLSFLIRVLPMTAIRKQIKSRFVRSFLHYVPYVTLAVMTFPSILDGGESFLPGLAALIGGTVLAWFKGGLLQTALCCCALYMLVSLI